MFESSQKNECGDKQADSLQAGYKATACFVIFISKCFTQS